MSHNKQVSYEVWKKAQYLSKDMGLKTFGRHEIIRDVKTDEDVDKAEVLYKRASKNLDLIIEGCKNLELSPIGKDAIAVLVRENERVKILVRQKVKSYLGLKGRGKTSEKVPF